MSDTIMCLICGNEFQRISTSHLRKHGITFREYCEKFPFAEIISDRLKKISSEQGKKNKGRESWSKGKKMSDDFKKKVRESHWSKKPLEDTIRIREKMSINGTNSMIKINSEGKAFRMPKGYHTEEHKEKMRSLMLGRTVLWNDKIKNSHWTKKSKEEVQEIIDRIQQHGINHNCKRGWYFSDKMKEDFFYMSSYEERRMKFLDSCPEVVSFTNKHRIWINYVWENDNHKYNPDLLVTFLDGTKRIEEVKGFILDQDRVKAKERACIDYANKNGLQYKMIFENELEKI